MLVCVLMTALLLQSLNVGQPRALRQVLLHLRNLKRGREEHDGSSITLCTSCLDREGGVAASDLRCCLSWVVKLPHITHCN